MGHLLHSRHVGVLGDQPSLHGLAHPRVFARAAPSPGAERLPQTRPEGQRWLRDGVLSLQELVLFGTEAGFAHEQVLDP